MKIVFDSSVIFGIWRLDSPDFTVLKRLIEIEACKIFIPDIVVSETKNNYGEELRNSMTNKIIPKLNKLLPIDRRIVLDYDKLLQDYCTDFSNLLTELKVNIVSSDDISQNQVTSRLFSLRKPFNKIKTSDTGYRDTLIWELILNKIASTDEVTYFLTNNTNDFANENDKTQLHDDLKQDLVDRGLVDTCVCICCSLGEWIKSYGSEYLETADIAEELKANTYDQFSLEKWLEESMDIFRIKLDNNIDCLLPNYYELEDPSVTCVEKPSDVEIEEVLSVDKESLFLDVSMIVTVSIDFYINKWLDPDYNIPIIIWDADWNRYNSFVGTYFKLPIKFSAIYNIPTHSIDNVEIENYEVFGFCPNCGTAITHDAAEGCSICGKDFN